MPTRAARRLPVAALLLVPALVTDGCRFEHPIERYAFVARLGRDTIAVENVTRSGNELTSDAVDRFPRVRQRHTQITLAPDGGIRHLVMDITTPSEPEKQRHRVVVADVDKDSIIMTKRDAESFVRWAFADHGETVMAHVPQMYSLYELYFAAALRRIAGRGPGGSDTAQLRQFYIDREFDKFGGSHHGIVRRRADRKAEIEHDWLAGTGEATVDTSYRLELYSGARTTYKVEVVRVAQQPDVRAIGEQFAAVEAKNGGAKQLSVRDTTRATIGAATFAVDYGRPLARGRRLLGDVIPYGNVWRTGANAATQFTTSAPITIGDLKLAAGTYTLWTAPRLNSVALIVNTQTGQWGTGYDRSRDLGSTPMRSEMIDPPVDEFTISIKATAKRTGMLIMEWGTFRWSVSIVVGH